jgi:uncharacterized protein YndB with AHSA1/START domain
MALAKDTKTTFTMPSDREVAATRVFDAPRELVWKAHTVPEHVSRWLLGPEGWTMPVCEIDLRPGGEWHFVWRRADGSEMGMRGVYKEIVAPERIVNTERWGAEWPETTNTTVFTEREGKTTLVCTVRWPSKEDRDKAMGTGMNDGWTTSYERLADYLPKMG